MQWRWVMRESGLFLVLSLALGAIAVLWSETMFWTFPGPTMGPGEYALVVLVYGAACATAFSAVLLTGAGGWRGFWLAGAMFGFLIEGVIVGQMYLAFPFQLVWTPLAWHMLLTAGMLALIWRSVDWPLAKQILAMALAGLGFGLWGAWWPLEAPLKSGFGAAALYQFAGAGVAFLGLVVLGRFGRWPQPPRWGLWVMPMVALGVFVVQTIADPNPLRVFLPLMMALTVWGLIRARSLPRPSFRHVPAWRFLPLFIVPAVSVPVTALLIQMYGAIQANQVVALITTPLGLGLWLWLILRKPLAV